MRYPSRFLPTLLWIALSSCLLIQPACPTVIINSPPNGSQFEVGQGLVVTSTYQHSGLPLKEVMRWKYYGKMTDDELRAVWMYLRSLPALEQGK